jgi:hypothetical protein
LRELYREQAGLEPHELILRHELPPALEWWVDNFGLLRDIATRRYAAHVCSYQSLLEDPEAAIAEVLRWLGRGDQARAVEVVRPERQTVHASAPTPEHPEVDAEEIEVFDELYDHIHRGRALSAAFLVKLNDTDARLRPRLLAHEAQARVAAAQAMLAEVGPAKLS